MRAVLLVISACLLYACEAFGPVPGNRAGNTGTKEAATDANLLEESGFEVVILDPGFEPWLATQPPMGTHSLSYLEEQNKQYVKEYNRRVFDPAYSEELYTQEIYYDPEVRYGLEVNHLMYNYFRYFEQEYDQKF